MKYDENEKDKVPDKAKFDLGVEEGQNINYKVEVSGAGFCQSVTKTSFVYCHFGFTCSDDRENFLFKLTAVNGLSETQISHNGKVPTKKADSKEPKKAENSKPVDGTNNAAEVSASMTQIPSYSITFTSFVGLSALLLGYAVGYKQGQQKPTFRLLEHFDEH